MYSGSGVALTLNLVASCLSLTISFFVCDLTPDGVCSVVFLGASCLIFFFTCFRFFQLFSGFSGKPEPEQPQFFRHKQLNFVTLSSFCAGQQRARGVVKNLKKKLPTIFPPNLNCF